MLTFYLMAPHAIAMLGARTFLALYCGGGLAASAATLSNPSNGASGVLWFDFFTLLFHLTHITGAVGSTLGFFAAANPHATFSLYFFLPVQAWWVSNAARHLRLITHALFTGWPLAVW